MIQRGAARPKILYRPSSLQYPVLAMVEEFRLWQQFGLDPDVELQVSILARPRDCEKHRTGSGGFRSASVH